MYAYITAQLVDEHWVLDRNPEGIALIKGQGGQVRILSQLDENITVSFNYEHFLSYVIRDQACSN